MATKGIMGKGIPKRLAEAVATRGISEAVEQARNRDSMRALYRRVDALEKRLAAVEAKLAARR